MTHACGALELGPDLRLGPVGEDVEEALVLRPLRRRHGPNVVDPVQTGLGRRRAAPSHRQTPDQRRQDRQA